MRFLYNIGILIYTALARLISPFSAKAKLMVAGRKNWERVISEKISAGDKTAWIHCASLGEFEQGRPIIEAIRKERPGIKIVLTFFSPSGYEVRKNYAEADCIAYLPADTPSNAHKFLKLVHPAVVIFVKYEFWANYINAVHSAGTPLYLVSGIFRPQQHFFSWYGSWFRSLLRKFDRIFVQDNASLKLLAGIGMSNVSVAGDTRFDRVVKIAASAKEIPVLSEFKNGGKLILAGSSWAPDEEIMARYINGHTDNVKWVFAPHEIHKSNIERLEKLFGVKTVRFSEFKGSSDAKVLIIDNIGMLSSAYRYADIAAIGGGFGKGIHNVLEAACWGIPVLFGPRHEKFREAVELIKENGAMSFDSFGRFEEIINKWLTDEAFYLTSANAALQYVKKNTGATEMIMGEVIHRI